MIQYCLRNGIELTRSRPYRKNDQAWIEQKNGAVVRKLLGYRRFEGIAAAQAIGRLYGASRLFVNFFQPSFKLAEKHRQGAQVSKRYHPPATPYERLLQAETVSDAIKAKLREVGIALDPLKRLEEVRAMQSHLVVLAMVVEPMRHPCKSRICRHSWPACLARGGQAKYDRPTPKRRTHVICDHSGKCFLSPPLQHDS